MRRICLEAQPLKNKPIKTFGIITPGVAEKVGSYSLAVEKVVTGLEEIGMWQIFGGDEPDIYLPV